MKRARRLAITFAVLGLTACAGPTLNANPAPGTRPAVRVTWQIHQQQPDTAVAAFDPVELRISQAGEAAWSPLDLHPLAEMRYCLDWQSPCVPDGNWQPYQLAVEFSLEGGPAGADELWLGAAFRGRDAQPIEAFVDPADPQLVVQVLLAVGR